VQLTEARINIGLPEEERNLCLGLGGYEHREAWYTGQRAKGLACPQHRSAVGARHCCKIKEQIKIRKKVQI
jgi:hypothetical protein